MSGNWVKAVVLGGLVLLAGSLAVDITSVVEGRDERRGNAGLVCFPVKEYESGDGSRMAGGR